MPDLIIKGGYLVDPSQGIEGTMDLEIRRGRVRRVAPAIEPGGRPTLNARGRIVTPGLVDLHCHFFEGVSHYGVNLEGSMLARGVTTAVDTGSAGAQTFSTFRDGFLRPARMGVRAFLNISAGGLLLEGLGENIEMRALRVDDAVECYRANRDLLLGMKVRLSRNVVERSGGRPLDAALEASRALRAPLMVHVGDTPDSLPKILKKTPARRCSHPRVSRPGREHPRPAGPGAPGGLGGPGPGGAPRRRPRAVELQF